jgi:hypothetical protein
MRKHNHFILFISLYDCFISFYFFALFYLLLPLFYYSFYLTRIVIYFTTILLYFTGARYPPASAQQHVILFYFTTNLCYFATCPSFISFYFCDTISFILLVLGTYFILFILFPFYLTRTDILYFDDYFILFFMCPLPAC